MSETRQGYCATYTDPKTGLRTIMGQSWMKDDVRDAKDMLDLFKMHGELPKVHTTDEIASMRVDMIECWQNGDPQGVYVHEEGWRDALGKFHAGKERR